MKKYKEPEIQFISLNSSENIANPCWSNVNHPEKYVFYYYDLPGTGSLEFRITEGNKGGCDAGVPTSVSYVVDLNKDGVITDDEKREATAEQCQTLYEAMHVRHEIGHGNSGENTSGSDFSTDHFPGWS